MAMPLLIAPPSILATSHGSIGKGIGASDLDRALKLASITKVVFEKSKLGLDFYSITVFAQFSADGAKLKNARLRLLLQESQTRPDRCPVPKGVCFVGSAAAA